VRGPVKKFDANDFKAEREGLEALARSKEFVQAVYDMLSLAKWKVI
jgi:hypothetical protein